MGHRILKEGPETDRSVDEAKVSHRDTFEVFARCWSVISVPLVMQLLLADVFRVWRGQLADDRGDVPRQGEEADLKLR
jgi:hypothetical protein